MDINKFIADKCQHVSGNLCETDQLTFAMVHALDKNHRHIPEWYKTLRVGKLIDYFINERIITKSQIRYRFTLGYGFDPIPFNDEFKLEQYQLTNFTIFDLSLEELIIISNILPSEDIKAEIDFKVSVPYYLDGDKDKLLQKYKLYCKL